MPTVEDRVRALWSSRSDDPAEYVEPSYTFSTSTSTRRSMVKLLVFVIAVTGIFVWLNRPQAPVIPQVITSGTPLTTLASASSTTNIVVDVEGKVRHPGLRTLPNGSRVADALAAAGGLLPGVPSGALNLAARLSDGQLLFVGTPPNSSFAGSTDSAGASAATNQISLNSAGQSDLESLPGVGPVLAKRILDWRTSHGAFGSLEELQNVPGIGPKVFANLATYLTL